MTIIQDKLLTRTYRDEAGDCAVNSDLRIKTVHTRTHTDFMRLQLAYELTELFRSLFHCELEKFCSKSEYTEGMSQHFKMFLIKQTFLIWVLPVFLQYDIPVSIA